MFLQDSGDMINSSHIVSDTVIINQCDENKYEEFYLQNNKIRVFSYKEKGLSRSRNRGLENIADDTDIVCITDDDVIFEDNYKEIIRNGYENNKKADIISFNVRRSNGRLNKKLPKKPKYISVFRICSVSITFNAKKVKKIIYSIKLNKFIRV